MKKTVLIFAMVLLLALVVFSTAMGAVNPANCSHSSCKWVTKTAATCSAGGTDWWTCNTCGKALYFRNTAKNPNNHPSASLTAWTTVTKATCSATGSEKRTCTKCNKIAATRTTDKDPNNHPSASLSGWTTVTKATCTSTGSEKRTCSKCNKTAATRTTAKDPNNHQSWRKWSTYREPCEHREGGEHRFCACGKEQTQSIPKDPPGSYKPNWKKISDQTCTTDEVWEAVCPTCRKTEHKTTAQATGHHKCNSNNNTWPYPNLCEDKYYEEWCDNQGCPENKHRKVYIPGTRHYPMQDYRDGKYVIVCSVCGTTLPDDYSRYPGF